MLRVFSLIGERMKIATHGFMYISRLSVRNVNTIPSEEATFNIGGGRKRKKREWGKTLPMRGVCGSLLCPFVPLSLYSCRNDALRMKSNRCYTINAPNVRAVTYSVTFGTTILNPCIRQKKFAVMTRKMGSRKVTGFSSGITGSCNLCSAYAGNRYVVVKIIILLKIPAVGFVRDNESSVVLFSLCIPVAPRVVHQNRTAECPSVESGIIERFKRNPVFVVILQIGKKNDHPAFKHGGEGSIEKR